VFSSIHIIHVSWPLSRKEDEVRGLIWKRLMLPLVSVFIVSAAVFGWLYVRADAERQVALEIEAGKVILQLIATVLVGNIVLLIVKDFEERRKAWQTKQEEWRKAWQTKQDLLRTDLTDGLQTLYSRAKSARRRLRANVKVENDSIETKKYDELFQEINDVQLGLERYKRQAKGGVRTGLLPESLPSDLESMEKYLGEFRSANNRIYWGKNANLFRMPAPDSQLHTGKSLRL
jgi:large-conductance mechanosensitive channel